MFIDYIFEANGNGNEIRNENSSENGSDEIKIDEKESQNDEIDIDFSLVYYCLLLCLNFLEISCFFFWFVVLF